MYICTVLIAIVAVLPSEACVGAGAIPGWIQGIIGGGGGGGTTATTTTMTTTTTTEEGKPTTTTMTKTTTSEGKPATLKFVIVDLIGKAVTSGSVKWEKSVCAATSFNIAGGKNVTIEYTAECGNLMSIDGDSDGKACETFKTEIARPILFQVKTKTGAGAGNCEFYWIPTKK